MSYILKFYFYLVIVFTLLSAFTYAEVIEPEAAITFEIQMDETELSYISNKKNIHRIKNSNKNYSLLLERDENLALSFNNSISAKSGAVSFWVKPQWDDEKTSHTFMSMKWDGAEPSYMVISYGWWEPAGKERLYFVLSNRDKIHCSIPYKFDLNVWTMISASWNTGKKGHCSIYVNDEILIGKKHTKISNRKPSSDLFLNSDIGSGISAGRSHRTVYDDISIYEESLSHLDVVALYKKTKNQLNGYSGYSWMTRVLSKPYVPLRNAEGKILESRVIFDEDIYWATSRSATDEIVSKIYNAGFNVYIPNVWHGKGAYFSTDKAIVHPLIEKRISKGDDPLDYLLHVAHKKNIQVHPWFTVMKREGDVYPEFHDASMMKGSFNVHNPKFRTFISDLIVDVVQRYPVDGVNLDYIRSIDYCKSEKCKNDYTDTYNRYLILDVAARKLPGIDFQSISKWNNAAVSQIVRDVSERSRSLNPNIIISVDSVPFYKGLTLQGQDSISWANNGWVDVIYIMDYKKKFNIDRVKRVRDALIEEDKAYLLLATFDVIKDKNDNKVVIHRPKELVADYISMIRRLWPNTGVGFYHYKQITEDQFSYINNNLYYEAAAPGWLRK